MTHRSSHAPFAHRPHRRRGAPPVRGRRTRGPASTGKARTYTSLAALKPPARNSLQPGTVALARVPHRDGGHKVRPVVVIAAERDEVLVVPVTSSLRSRYLTAWVPIGSWHEAGLDRPSAACCGQGVWIDRRTEVLRTMGALAPDDQGIIEARLASC